MQGWSKKSSLVGGVGDGDGGDGKDGRMEILLLGNNDQDCTSACT